MQIGGKRKSGKKHDSRTPDYDDWTRNGDIMFWHEVLNSALEISSMGIRVDEDVLQAQLKETDCEQRSKLPFHRILLAGQLLYTIGGGIEQSRLYMLLLGYMHVGEVQAGEWSDEMREKCAQH